MPEQPKIVYGGIATNMEWNILRRQIEESLGAALLETCWVTNCNRPQAAIMRNHKGHVTLLCKKHARKPQNTRFLEFIPAGCD